MAIFCVSVAIGQAQVTSQSDDWTAVTTAIGRAGAIQPDGAMKYSLPRSDLAVTLDGVQLKPALALGSWIAFRRTGNGGAMAMGDLVLSAAEESPVISALQQGDVQQTAV